MPLDECQCGHERYLHKGECQIALCDCKVYRDGDGWNTDEKCPWCDASISEIYEFADDEDSEFDCPHCERPIRLSRWVRYITRKVLPKAEAGEK